MVGSCAWWSLLAVIGHCRAASDGSGTAQLWRACLAAGTCDAPRLSLSRRQSATMWVRRSTRRACASLHPPTGLSYAAMPSTRRCLGQQLGKLLSFAAGSGAHPGEAARRCGSFRVLPPNGASGWEAKPLVSGLSSRRSRDTHQPQDAGVMRLGFVGGVPQGGWRRTRAAPQYGDLRTTITARRPE